jgi:hypothetical protein
MASEDYESHEDTTESEQVTSQDNRKITGVTVSFHAKLSSPVSAPETCDDIVQIRSIKRRRRCTFNQFLKLYQLLRSMCVLNTKMNQICF